MGDLVRSRLLRSIKEEAEKGATVQCFVRGTLAPWHFENATSRFMQGILHETVAWKAEQAVCTVGRVRRITAEAEKVRSSETSSSHGSEFLD